MSFVRQSQLAGEPDASVIRHCTLWLTMPDDVGDMREALSWNLRSEAPALPYQSVARLDLVLYLVQLPVEPLLRHQLLMRPHLRDVASFEHDNRISAPDR